MKRCPKCGATKPLSEFTPDKSKASGYASRCKPCDAERSREYYARTGGEKARARYQANREKRTTQSRAAARARYLADPEATRRKWREDSQKRGPQKRSREKERARYMKRHGGIGEWARMYADQGGLCYLCQRPLPADGKDVHVDHDHTCCDVGPRSSQSCKYCRRGLTHQACNQIWGLARENPALLRAMADNGGRVAAETRLRIAGKPVIQEALGAGVESAEAESATAEAVPPQNFMPSLEMPDGASWPPAEQSALF